MRDLGKYWWIKKNLETILIYIILRKNWKRKNRKKSLRNKKMLKKNIKKILKRK